MISNGFYHYRGLLNNGDRLTILASTLNLALLYYREDVAASLTAASFAIILCFQNVL